MFYVMNHISGFPSHCKRILLWIILMSVPITCQTAAKDVIIAAPGENVLLSCQFPVIGSLNITNLIIKWQEKDTVVHSFYLGRDQLERQGQAYSGRTHLFKEQILTGNASLVLNNVQPQHQGEYFCYVNDENGRTKHNVLLTVAAPYDDPKLSVLYTCDLVIVTLTSSQGFPQPTVTWKHPVGSNVTTTELDTKGCYRVESNLTFSLNTTQTVVVEMSLDVLSQHFIREITLQPQQGCCEGSADHIRGKYLLAIPLSVFITLLLRLWIRISQPQKICCKCLVCT